MPRKLLKRYLPDPSHFKEHKSLGIISDWLQEPNLWHLNRRSASLACFVGMLCAFVPLPAQMLMAAVAAIIVRCNLPLAAALVWLSNPLTMPAIFFASYHIGMFTLQRPATSDFEFSLEGVQHSLANSWEPMLVGLSILALTTATTSFFAVRLLWRWNVVYQWRKRKKQRQNART